MDDELIGRLVLGRYRVIQQLARGGMGVVYLGRLEGAAGFSRPVVIKRVHPELDWDDTISKLFVREARILSNLQHPNIVSVVDFAKENDDYMMILEYVHGYNASQWQRYLEKEKRSLDPEHAMLIAIRVLDALHYAHTFKRPDGSALHIVHRDVSPSNILLDAQGQIKLHDFGIARAEDADELKTQGSGFKGKLAYSAPETFSGAVATPLSDVYSTGVVLYQLVSGSNPFRGKEAGETIRRVLVDDPPPLSVLREELPDGLDEVVARAMAREPDARFESAAKFCEALRKLARPESDVVAELAATLRNDFNGVPNAMRVLSLEERDAAWRNALGPNERVSLSSWPPPLETTIREAPSESLLRLDGNEPPAGATLQSLPVSHPAPAAQPERAVWPIALGAAAIAAVVVAGSMAVLGRRSESSAAPRYLVVERQANASSQDSSETPPASASTSVTADVPGDPSRATPTAEQPDVRGSTASESHVPLPPDPARLSQTFRRHQSAIQGCFDRNAEQIRGGPQISVRLHVDTSGRVESAELVPAGLSSTALGQCLLGVARSVSFGPLQREVGFTIPITARRVQ